MLEILCGDPSRLDGPGAGADEPVQGLGQPGGGEVDTELAAFLAATEEGGDAGVGPVPALVDLVALEELVLVDEEGQQSGAGLDGRDEAAEPLLGGVLVEPGGVQGRLELLDTEILQRLHQGVAPGEVAVEGGAADARSPGDLVHGGGRFVGQQGGGAAQHLLTVESHETTITHVRHLRLIGDADGAEGTVPREKSGGEIKKAAGGKTTPCHS